MEPLERVLEASRRARSDGDGPACRRALREAQRIAAEGVAPERVAQVAWRRAKAEYDFGDARGISEALEPVLDLDAPFAGSEAALGACELLVRRMRDQGGYADPLPDELLQRAAAAWRDRADPVRALWIDVQRAWSLACRGELAVLETLTDNADRMRARDVAHSQFRHARAESAALSLAWMQLDLWRAALRGATWTEDDAAIGRALDGIEDAAEDAGLRRLADPWFLEAVVSAQWQLGRADSPGYAPALERCLERVDGARGALHRLLFAGWSSLRSIPTSSHFVEAADVAGRAAAGPEWQAWAWRGAQRAGHADAEGRLAQIVVDRGVHAFRDLRRE
ncbi:MAG: hypothetical protein KC912_12470 [Proteobacteria bacterium]|nr:hypothetical protein [Pseudomonadota bacterium]